jgi:hypothetical protein
MLIPAVSPAGWPAIVGANRLPRAEPVSQIAPHIDGLLCVVAFVARCSHPLSRSWCPGPYRAPRTRSEGAMTERESRADKIAKLVCRQLHLAFGKLDRVSPSIFRRRQAICCAARPNWSEGETPT